MPLNRNKYLEIKDTTAMCFERKHHPTAELTFTKMEYTLSILQIYCKYTSKVSLKYTLSALEVHLKFTSSILQVYFNLLNWRKRSILQVYVISTKEVHLKHIF